MDEQSEEYAHRCAGVVATACTQGKRTQHGKPDGVVSNDQPEAREGQRGTGWAPWGGGDRITIPATTRPSEVR